MDFSQWIGPVLTGVVAIVVAVASNSRSNSKLREAHAASEVVSAEERKTINALVSAQQKEISELRKAVARLSKRVDEYEETIRVLKAVNEELKEQLRRQP